MLAAHFVAPVSVSRSLPRRPAQAWWRCVALTACLLWASSVLAARILVEPPALMKIARSASATAISDASKLDGSEPCQTALFEAGLIGLRCRANVATVVVGAAAPVLAKEITARAQLAADLLKAADAVRSFEPLSAQPGFSRARFDAHSALSRALMITYDSLVNVPAQSAVFAAAQAALAMPADLKQRVCLSAQGSLDLAAGADASVEERGRAQSLITSHRCFLDESRLRVEPKPGAALKDNLQAKAVQGSVGDVGIVKQYASARSIDLKRCTDRHSDDNSAAGDTKKLETCVCGVIARWKFPARATDTATRLPLTPTAEVDVTIAAGGTATVCGPMRTSTPSAGASTP